MAEETVAPPDPANLIGPFKLTVEITGQTFDDLMAAHKEVGKDLRENYLSNVGGKRGGAYVFKITRHDGTPLAK